jgi:hypothetical protein
MNMKRIFLPVLVSLGLALVGCDSDTKSNETSEKTIVVELKSPDVIDGKGVYQFDGNGWRVICTSSTKLFMQNETCTGLEKSNPESVRIGDTLLFKFYRNDANYSGSPNVAYATTIEVYRPECLAPPAP